MQQPRLLIDGKWIDTGSQLTVTNPFSGDVIAQVPLGDESTIDEAIGSARRAFAEVRRTAPHARSAQLQAIARGIDARRAQFAQTIVAEAGKPIVFAEAEVTRAITT